MVFKVKNFFALSEKPIFKTLVQTWLWQIASYKTKLQPFNKNNLHAFDRLINTGLDDTLHISYS